MSASPHRLGNPHRLHGLDTLRSAAVLLVVAYHYAVFASGEPTFGAASRIGWAGVDLFFVLSGYLIGRQVLRPQVDGQRLDLRGFYLRRALRTLPNYWVMVALYLAFPAFMGGVPRTEAWQFLTFTQNFGLRPGSAFSHAWSLCIEEQFYLLLPACALTVAATRRPTLWSWAGLGAAIAAATGLRALMWRAHGQDAIDYYIHVYYATVTRFDELLPGVALALMQLRHPALWLRLTGRHRLTGLLGLAGSAGTLTWFELGHGLPDGSLAMGPSVFGYPLLAWSLALLVLNALSPGALLHRLRLPGAAALAIGSYALYLVHKPVFHLARSNWPRLDVAGPLGVAVLLVLSALAAWALYAAVEAPVMRWRARRLGPGEPVAVPVRTRA